MDKEKSKTIVRFQVSVPELLAPQMQNVGGGQVCAGTGGENDGLISGSVAREALAGLLDGDVWQSDWQILNQTARKRSGWRGRRE